MPRKKETLDDLVNAAIAAPDSVQRRRITANARRKAIAPTPKNKGRPTTFNQNIANDILERIGNGETLPKIVEALNIPIGNIYNWMDSNPNFLEKYRIARERMALTLVDRMINESESINDPLALKVRSQILQWVAARFNPKSFSDSKRLELSGQINHTHTHQLTEDQKRRIAESWLLSQTNDVPAIEGEIIADDEGVETISDQSPREIPQRKALEAPKRKKRAVNPDDW